MNDITKPLQLAVGSHKAGSGKGCAMNVISWENGDTTITDFPECVQRDLAGMVQSVNDGYCTHTKSEYVTIYPDVALGEGLFVGAKIIKEQALCADCSVKVLDLAHRTVGTNLGRDLTPEEQCILSEAWQDCEGGDTIERGHAMIDQFHKMFGTTDKTTPPEVTAGAVAKMLEGATK